MKERERERERGERREVVGRNNKREEERGGGQGECIFIYRDIDI